MRPGDGYKLLLPRLCLLAALVCTGGIHAESPTVAAKKPSRKRKVAAIRPHDIPVGSLMAVMSSPRALPPPDKLYRQYFSVTDHAIYQQYVDRWAYHEMQVPYAATAWKHEHLSIGSRDFFGRAPYEGDVRRDFANHVLRIRLDAAIREYFKGSPGARGVARAEKTMRQIKSMPVKISNKPGGGQIHIGYDVQSDASKLEYSQSGFNAGIYHPRLLSALTGGANFNELTVRLGVTLDKDLPSAGFAYQPATTVVELALSQTVSRRLATRLVSISSSRPDIAPSHEYRVEISYQF